MKKKIKTKKTYKKNVHKDLVTIYFCDTKKVRTKKKKLWQKKNLTIKKCDKKIFWKKNIWDIKCFWDKLKVCEKQKKLPKKVLTTFSLSLKDLWLKKNVTKKIVTKKCVPKKITIL